MAHNNLIQQYWREQLQTTAHGPTGTGTQPRQHQLPPPPPPPQPSERQEQRLQRHRLRQQQARPIPVAPANGPPSQQQPQQPNAPLPLQPGNALLAPPAQRPPPNHPAAAAAPTRPSHQVPAPPRRGRFSVTEWTMFLWDCVVDAFILLGQVAIVLWFVYNLRRLHSNLYPELYQPHPLSMPTNASLLNNSSTVFDSVPSAANSSAYNHSNVDAVDTQNEPVVSVKNDTCAVPLVLDLDIVDESTKSSSSTAVDGTTIGTATRNGGTASSTTDKDDNPNIFSSNFTRFLFLDNATCPAAEPQAFDALVGLDEQPVTAIESIDGYVAPVGSNSSSSTLFNSSEIADGHGTDVDTVSEIAIGHDDATVLYDGFSNEDATTVDMDLGASINIAVPTSDTGVFPSKGSESTDDKLQSQIAAATTSPPASAASSRIADDSPAAAQPTDTISGIYNRTLVERVVASVRDISNGIVTHWLIWIATIFIAFILGRCATDPVVQQQVDNQNQRALAVNTTGGSNNSATTTIITTNGAASTAANGTTSLLSNTIASQTSSSSTTATEANNSATSVPNIDRQKLVHRAAAESFVTRLLFDTVAPLEAIQKSSASNNKMVFLLPSELVFAATTRLLQTQAEFRAAGKPTWVSLGYHYTQEENLPDIRVHGLLSPKERAGQSVKPQKENGANFGRGIYSASNPRAYHGKYGNVGIVVLQLLGKNKDFVERNDVGENDSVTVRRHEFGEFVVLSSSYQCVPVLGFDGYQIQQFNTLHPGNVLLDKYHAALQTLVDDFLNANAIPVTPVGTSPQYETIRYRKPSSLKKPPEKGPSRSQSRPAPLRRPQLSLLPADCCSVCLKHGGDGTPLVHRDGCQHVFHESCLAQFSPTACAACWKALGHHGLLGKMPSGVMTVRRRPADICSDYESTTTIEILYTIPSDTQVSYHAHPGKLHGGAYMFAYLPDTVQARNLLVRLKYAFRHGLTFNVTDKNGVIPSSISHKYSWNGGPDKNGFPDPDYFDQCNRQLDALCVPIASQCDMP